MAAIDQLAGLRSVDEIVSYRDELIAERKTLDAEFEGRSFSDEAREKFADLTEGIKSADALLSELEARAQLLDEQAAKPDALEGPTFRNGNGHGGYSRRAESRVPENVFNVAEYRNRARSIDDLPVLYREGAARAIETMTFPHERADRDEVVSHIQKLLENDGDGELARRILETGSPVYRRAFMKHIAGVGLTAEEERALSLTTTAGGFAVPVTLDPTVILTSNGVVNPMRRISRVVTITGNTWNGISSSGVVASYAAELTQTTDNAPTIAQPTATVEKAQAFIPFSIEIGEDWGSLQSEMAKMLQDAKDQLEATKFITGAGHGSSEPQGLLVGATAVVTTAAATTLAVGDLYSLEEALPPRYRPNASIIANRKQFNRVRQFDTSGGSSLWVQLGDGLPRALLGYPNYEASEMTSALTSGASIITIGDFSNYLIVDRVGMNIELLPHMLGSNRLPTGQRGLYAYWRNTAVVLAWQAFRTLKVT